MVPRPAPVELRATGPGAAFAQAGTFSPARQEYCIECAISSTARPDDIIYVPSNFIRSLCCVVSQ